MIIRGDPLTTQFDLKMANKELFAKAFEELKKNAPQKNFIQTVDLIINLADIDLRKTPIVVPVILPHPVKENMICGFLEKKSPYIDKTIQKAELMSDWPKSELKKLVRNYDLFIASASLMPLLAAKFGRTLGAAGKMPNPKTGGVLIREDENEIRALSDKLKKTLIIRPKEPSIKIAIGKENNETEKIADNAFAVYNAVLNVLPNRKENIRSLMLKLTMSKPVKLKEK
jgi:large subunit ribosomal protein L1